MRGETSDVEIRSRQLVSWRRDAWIQDPIRAPSNGTTTPTPSIGRTGGRGANA